MTDKLSSLIDTFLAERKESDGGWPSVKGEEIFDLSDIIFELIESKWSPDADGDSPVEFTLIDRTKYYKGPFLNIR